jgi:rRNA maturation protein Nop10
VRLACPRGCQGDLSLRAGGETVTSSPSRFSHAEGTREYSLELDRAARRELRDRGSLLVQARASVSQLSGSRTFKRALRVLAPR